MDTSTLLVQMLNLVRVSAPDLAAVLDYAQAAPSPVR